MSSTEARHLGANTGAGANIKLPIYLDYQATTPLDPRALEAMMPYFTEHFGNPHSSTHEFGATSAAAVERAREQVASLIGAEAREIVFTSGATEANNLAIKGVAAFECEHRKGQRKRVITVITEHKCVIETCKYLGRDGHDIVTLPVDGDGIVDLGDLAAAINDETLLVSVMGVNNETGVIQPLAEIGALCREHGAYLHSDCAQAVGKIPLDVNAMKIDLMSISGHKLYGPKGIGALYVRRRPRVRLLAMIDGGGQERGMRSGTLPTPCCVGFGEACAIAEAEMASDHERLAQLRDRLLEGITANTDGVTLNGDRTRRIPGNLNLSFTGVGGEQLVAALSDLAVSTGSACNSASVEPSYVLMALGMGSERADASIRFGIGRFTTEAEIDYAIQTVVGQLSRLRG
jgi:cysteine desulfurase